MRNSRDHQPEQRPSGIAAHAADRYVCNEPFRGCNGRDYLPWEAQGAGEWEGRPGSLATAPETVIVWPTRRRLDSLKGLLLVSLPDARSNFPPRNISLPPFMTYGLPAPIELCLCPPAQVKQPMRRRESAGAVVVSWNRQEPSPPHEE
jgi:hypothetical protein